MFGGCLARAVCYKVFRSGYWKLGLCLMFAIPGRCALRSMRPWVSRGVIFPILAVLLASVGQGLV